MLKDMIGKSVENMNKTIEKEIKNRKKGDRAPLQYSNELEITVTKNKEPIQVFTHK